MTDAHFAPKWYPVYAVPVLFFTVICALLSGKTIAIWEKFTFASDKSSKELYGTGSEGNNQRLVWKKATRTATIDSVKLKAVRPQQRTSKAKPQAIESIPQSSAPESNIKDKVLFTDSPGHGVQGSSLAIASRRTAGVSSEVERRMRKNEIAEESSQRPYYDKHSGHIVTPSRFH
jgi:hypothetical protein